MVWIKILSIIFKIILIKSLYTNTTKYIKSKICFCISYLSVKVIIMWRQGLNLKIILDIGSSSTIWKVISMSKLNGKIYYYDLDNPSSWFYYSWKCQKRLLSTRVKCKNDATRKCQVDYFTETSQGRILGRCLFITLVIGIKYSCQVTVAGVEQYNGCTLPMANLSHIDIKLIERNVRKIMNNHS